MFGRVWQPSINEHDDDDDDDDDDYNRGTFPVQSITESGTEYETDLVLCLFKSRK